MYKKILQIIIIIGLVGINPNVKGLGVGYCSLTFNPGTVECPSGSRGGPTHKGWTSCVACLTPRGLNDCGSEACCESIAKKAYGQYMDPGRQWVPWYHPTCIGYEWEGCECCGDSCTKASCSSLCPTTEHPNTN